MIYVYFRDTVGQWSLLFSVRLNFWQVKRNVILELEGHWPNHLVVGKKLSEKERMNRV